MKPITTGQKIVVAILIVAIIAGVIITAKNKDIWFTSIVEIKYPDGCIETYHNDALVTPECTEGRALMEKQSYRTRIPSMPIPTGGNFTGVFNGTTITN